jgi:hypothetical protein
MDPHSNPLGLPAPPPDAIGFGLENAALDLFAGFADPPPGYGEVAFYWWVGDKLTRERLAWQLDRLAGMGIMGLQINYPHGDIGGRSFGLTTPSDPPLFSDEWWELVTWFAAEAKARGMAISLSDYTLSGPGQGQWTDEILAENPDLNASILECEAFRVSGGERIEAEVPPGAISIAAWKMPFAKDKQADFVDLRERVNDRVLRWVTPAGSWQVAIICANKVDYSIDPLDPRTGALVVDKFFQRFENRLPGESGKALNFFFSDELEFGASGLLWHARLPDAFRRRHGYDIVPELFSLFVDTGPRATKVRLDFNDVMVSLEEEAFFEPVTTWHQERGMLYGGDHGGRGYNPTEFGDYFRTQRWMNAPGNDQSHLGTDVVRTKVHSSIAHLYRQPRVWLEGYYGSGWGTTPADLIEAGIENYCLGANLQTFHGLYYTTFGGWWEWAPPCNHFRMPYWRHMKPLMTWTQRLCFLLSRGFHRCDVAIVYPVSPRQAGLDAGNSAAEAFAIANGLFHRGIDFDFIDEDSVARASVVGDELRVAGEQYRALILPSMSALHFATMEKAAEFATAGGAVIASGCLPGASDRAGGNDPVLDELVSRTFGVDGTRRSENAVAQPRAPGKFMPVAAGKPTVDAIVDEVAARVDRDFVATRAQCHVLHRVAGAHHVYLLTNLRRGDVCFFRGMHASPELWDAFTGQKTPVSTCRNVAGGVEIVLPRDAVNGLLIVFPPSDAALEADPTKPAQAGPKPVPGEIPIDGEWSVRIVPTCDNRFGDFRLPATDAFIGPEARIMRHSAAADLTLEAVLSSQDNVCWERCRYGMGAQFLKLAPVPAESITDELLADLSGRAAIDRAIPVEIGSHRYEWQTVDFSWREGIEGDPGHQGYHGLKGMVSDDFLGLGKPGVVAHPVFRSGYPTYVAASDEAGAAIVWTTVELSSPATVRIFTGDLKPSRLVIGGIRIDDGQSEVRLAAGRHAVVAYYDRPGRTHLVLQDNRFAEQPERRTPLSMRWYDMDGLLRFDPSPESLETAQWYRFESAPGLAGLKLLAHGDVDAWIDGEPCEVRQTDSRRDGAAGYELSPSRVYSRPAQVTLKTRRRFGFNGGGVIPGPIEQVCEVGLLGVGDWSQREGLASYSGCIVYSQSVRLAAEDATRRAVLCLGDVAASALARINGADAGIALCAPWEIDITGLVAPGENRIEIEVCNTLANHYQTIPSNYRGSPKSGLIGPVSIRLDPA